MTTTTFTRGFSWSRDLLYDPANWGPETTDEQARALGELVRDRFHKLVADAGCSAYWLPETSEVIGDVGDNVTTAQLEAWRDQAASEVWEAVLGESGDEELTRQVNAVFERKE